MAEEHSHTAETAEVQDRGLFGFGKKKEEKADEEVLFSGEKIHIQEEKPDEKRHTLFDKLHEEKLEEEKKHTLLDKLHHSGGSSSSSSSDEEADEEKKERRRRKKGLKEKIKEKLHGDDKAVVVEGLEDNIIAVEKVETEAALVAPEEEKGFLEKIKEKLPGYRKTSEEEVVEFTPPPSSAPVASPEGEKKGFLEKIKEKVPGYHKSGGEVGEKAAASE